MLEKTTKPIKNDVENPNYKRWILVLICVCVFLYPHTVLFFRADGPHLLSELIKGGFHKEVFAVTFCTLVYIVTKTSFSFKLSRDEINTLWFGLISAGILAFNLDIFFIWDLSKNYTTIEFSSLFISYWHNVWLEYAALCCAAWTIFALGVIVEGKHKPLYAYAFLKKYTVFIFSIIPIGYLALPLGCSFYTFGAGIIFEAAEKLWFDLHVFFAVEVAVVLAILLIGLAQKEVDLGSVCKKLKALMFIISTIFVCETVTTAHSYLGNTRASAVHWMLDTKEFLKCFSPVLLIAIISYFLWRALHLKSKLGKAKTDISGDFGSARFSTIEDLKAMNFYDPSIGPLLGQDKSGHFIYTPLVNKLTLSPPGGGKTTTSSIPLLLTHNGPVFVFDVKGELWATSSKYREEVMGRQVIALDPFKVTQKKGFFEGKSDTLLKEYCLNPFDWLPSNRQALDRVMNAFASSFVVDHGQDSSGSAHFEENSKILIRGYIDYLMRGDQKERNLPELYRLISASLEESDKVLSEMSALGGRASGAANQIGRVGPNERGSILSTAYRQIDWMGDSNIASILSSSNFTLTDFIKGNMDIFIIIPEDQVREHGRLMRMVMALLMGQIIQATPQELPKQKIVFLLEELAQLGRSPDVELCIEVLRARGVVVWSVFQALSQIEFFEKPDLFKGAMLKQIFTLDDTDTMKWVQELAGRKTVLTKGFSEDKGNTRQSNQWLGGSISRGKGENVHETGVDLVNTNEIREMDRAEQLVFYQGVPPIKCRKVPYFEHPELKLRAEENPLA